MVTWNENGNRITGMMAKGLRDNYSDMTIDQGPKNYTLHLSGTPTGPATQHSALDLENKRKMCYQGLSTGTEQWDVANMAYLRTVQREIHNQVPGF